VAGVVFMVVLGAAVMHACWNAIAKAIPDHRVAAGLMALVGLGAGGVGVAVLPSPLPASWPFLGTSVVLQAGYLLLLTRAYRYGEFGQVYPLARGLPPLLVAGFSVTVLGERLSPGQLAGVVVVSLALTGLVFAGSRPRPGTGLGLAAVTGAVIACYTLVDGVGVRYSGQPLSYAMWLSFGQAPLVLAAARGLFGRGFGRALAGSVRLGLLCGALALVAYALVLWAQSRAPLSLVSALRETSVLFAGVLGTLVFREPFSGARLAATVSAVVGVVMLQAA
jgi:drug/metabolite transporter (DMT)-like permease